MTIDLESLSERVEHREAASEALSMEFEALRAMIRAGESTGDPVNDFILSHYGIPGTPEVSTVEESLRNMETSFKGKRWEPVMAVNHFSWWTGRASSWSYPTEHHTVFLRFGRRYGNAQWDIDEGVTVPMNRHISGVCQAYDDSDREYRIINDKVPWERVEHPMHFSRYEISTGHPLSILEPSRPDIPDELRTVMDHGGLDFDEKPYNKTSQLEVMSGEEAIQQYFRRHAVHNIPRGLDMGDDEMWRNHHNYFDRAMETLKSR